MAAYAALVSLINDLDLIPIHPTHSFSFDHKQIASLSQTVNSLIHFMDTYVPHGSTREAAQVLDRRIASAAHAAHDVIESHVVDQIHAGTTLGRKPRSYVLLDLQKAIHAMEFVERKAILFKERSGLKQTWKNSAPEPRISRKNAAMVGFDDVVVRLMEKLIGEPSSRRIVPVVGMGGIGKTTLAKNVYENFCSAHHFDVCRWATISHDYSVESILAELVTGERNVCELGENLHKMLWSRRYLIVLDDMWSVEAWDEIQRFLPDSENGSCVIVTTRLSNLAANLSSSPFKMDLLDDDRSWKLFCGSAFGEEDCPVELEELGKRIVKRCGGLPLSIVVIGGNLRRSSRSIEYWEMVANSMNPNSGLGEDDQCLKTISLSYEYLPACLKPCFLYLGIFEEDAWIDASKLIKFWVAEGFIKHCESLSLEEVAEDCLEDLIDRNFVFVHRRKWNGKVEYCRIHDIVRELCLKVGKQEKFLGVPDTKKAIGAVKERRVVVPMELSSLQRQAVGALQLPSQLRSLLGQGRRLLDELSVDLRLLRLLAYVNLDIYLKKKYSSRYFQPAKLQQVNLRYLTLSVDPGALPYSILSSISLFWNIQTLIVNNAACSKVLPYEIWEMTQLRHLEFTGGCLLPDPLQQECIVLENLHTILGVRDLRFTKEVCQRLPNIKKLSVSYRYLPDDCSYFCPQNLGCLNKLESLKCYFSDDSKWRGVVGSFILPSSLVELSLSGCHWEDLTKIIKSLPRLGYLELIFTRGGPEWDFAEEELPRLKKLWILQCDDLIYWNADSSNFPVLENLYIWAAPKLSEIPFDIGEIPTLQCIDLNSCSVSAAVSAMRIVKEQESLGNEDLRLNVNFGEMEQVEKFQKTVQEECLTTNSLRLTYRPKIISRPS